MAGLGLLAHYFVVVQPIERAVAPSTPRNARIDLLASEPDAVILAPFVTGDAPRLLRGEALQRFRAQLWFTDNTDVGNVIGAFTLAMMGLPPVRDIATTFRDRAPVANHTCLTIGCMHWATTQQTMWGMGGLRGLGEALGPAVERRTETFGDYAAYRAAHAAVAADAGRWFALVGGAAVQPPPSGFRQVTISLPTQFVSARLGGAPPAADAVVQAELAALAQDLLRDTRGRLLDTFGVAPTPIWATKDGAPVISAAGGSAALPDLAQVSPGVQLEVPEQQLALVSERARALRRPAPDLAAVDAALARAFALWRLDASCLPSCGAYRLTAELRTEVEIAVAAKPSWILDYWIVPAKLTR